jgi:hypothetical protein
MVVDVSGHPICPIFKDFAVQEVLLGLLGSFVTSVTSHQPVPPIIAEERRPQLVFHFEMLFLYQPSGIRDGSQCTYYGLIPPSESVGFTANHLRNV